MKIVLLNAADHDVLIERVLQHVNDRQNQSANALKAKVQELERSIKNNEAHSRALFEEKLRGSVPENLFQSMMQQYSCELEELQKTLREVEAAKSRRNHLTEDVARWTGLIEKCLRLEHFNRIMATELIESIIVHEPTGMRNERTFNLDIHYRFVGDLNPKNKATIA